MFLAIFFWFFLNCISIILVNGQNNPCQQVITDSNEGRIQYRDFSNKVDCEWIIKGQNNFDKISVHFSQTDYFQVTKPGTLEIFNQNEEILSSPTGSGHFIDKLELKSDGQIRVHLVSNIPGKSRGFLLTYKIFPTGFKNHGEICSESNSEFCNPFKMLSCKEGVCTCHLNSPDQMSYNPAQGQCITELKSPCKFPQGINKGEGKLAKCVQNTQCTSNGFCECDPDNYFENSEQICEIKKNFGQICNNSNECNQNNSLSCVDNICQCDLAKGQIPDLVKSKCVGQLGKPCIKRNCLENANCDGNICKCSKGFTQSSDMKCLRDFEEICSSQDLCSDLQFNCFDGYCKCKSPFKKLYDKDRGKCLSKLYGDCQTFEDCLQNMDCSEELNVKQCTCSNGYLPDNTGQCNPSFGTFCNKTSMNGLKCDPIAQLYCINGQCQCSDDLHIYSHDLRKCLGSVGSICESQEDCAQNENLFCKKKWIDLLYGRCEPNVMMNLTLNEIHTEMVENITEIKSEQTENYDDYYTFISNTNSSGLNESDYYDYQNEYSSFHSNGNSIIISCFNIILYFIFTIISILTL